MIFHIVLWPSDQSYAEGDIASREAARAEMKARRINCRGVLTANKVNSERYLEAKKNNGFEKQAVVILVDGSI